MSRSYILQISKAAEKQLKKIPVKFPDRIISAMLELANAPFPSNAKKLTGYSNTFRIRVSDYRIIYTVIEQTITINILKIGHRKNIYG